MVKLCLGVGRNGQTFSGNSSNFVQEWSGMSNIPRMLIEMVKFSLQVVRNGQNFSGSGQE